MYEYIKGKITDVMADKIIIENNNIGYEVYTSNPYYFEIDKEYKVYIYLFIPGYQVEDHHLFKYKRR